jgi:hypothetical protein
MVPPAGSDPHVRGSSANKAQHLVLTLSTRCSPPPHEWQIGGMSYASDQLVELISPAVLTYAQDRRGT